MVVVMIFMHKLDSSELPLLLFLMILATCRRSLSGCLVESRLYPLLRFVWVEICYFLRLGGGECTSPPFYSQKPDCTSQSKSLSHRFSVVTLSSPLLPRCAVLQPVSLRYELAKRKVLDDNYHDCIFSYTYPAVLYHWSESLQGHFLSLLWPTQAPR